MNRSIIIMPVVTILVAMMIVPNVYASSVIINAVKPGLPILPIAILVGGAHPDDFVGNITFFVNSTDGHYHLTGMVRNILPERAEIPTVGIQFYDKATQRALQAGMAEINYTVEPPGGTQHFDIDTGYNVTMAAKEWPYMYGEILS